MLVLTRKLGERLVIADSIVVTVVQVQGNKIRLGIEAPAGVPILREELRTGVVSRSPETRQRGAGIREVGAVHDQPS
ncbi:MAG TPA: carbon storage regulator [Gemmataceae bacterium]|nr:carbon storage regulator [Gemmataceae bacterium]